MIPGGLADRDGRIQRGDRVLSVNGKVLKDASHAQALSYLKDDRPDVVLVVARQLELEEDGKHNMCTEGERCLKVLDKNSVLRICDVSHTIRMLYQTGMSA